VVERPACIAEGERDAAPVRHFPIMINDNAVDVVVRPDRETAPAPRYLAEDRIRDIHQQCRDAAPAARRSSGLRPTSRRAMERTRDAHRHDPGGGRGPCRATEFPNEPVRGESCSPKRCTNAGSWRRRADTRTSKELRRLWRICIPTIAGRRTLFCAVLGRSEGDAESQPEPARERDSVSARSRAWRTKARRPPASRTSTGFFSQRPAPMCSAHRRATARAPMRTSRPPHGRVPRYLAKQATATTFHDALPILGKEWIAVEHSTGLGGCRARVREDRPRFSPAICFTTRSW